MLSYLGAVAWLYERAEAAGWVVLAPSPVLILAAAWLATPVATELDKLRPTAHGLDPATGGLVLGTTMAAMLLGHWYLNAPGMPLEPLMRLIGLLAVAVVLRAVVCAAGLGLEIDAAGWPDVSRMLFLACAGWAGWSARRFWPSWPGKRSKSRIRKARRAFCTSAVITTFLGELASGLLSAQAAYPL